LAFWREERETYALKLHGRINAIILGWVCMGILTVVPSSQPRLNSIQLNGEPEPKDRKPGEG
jgi:hypothetical protein